MYDEGNILIPSIQIYEGKFNELYNNIKNETIFTVNDNPPIFYFLSALLFPVTGKSLSATRIISFLSSFYANNVSLA